MWKGRSGGDPGFAIARVAMVVFACQHAGNNGAYGRFEVKDIGLCSLLLHQKSKLHQQHVDIYLSRPDAIVAAGAPSIADFKAFEEVFGANGPMGSKRARCVATSSTTSTAMLRCLAVGA